MPRCVFRGKRLFLLRGVEREGVEYRVLIEASELSEIAFKRVGKYLRNVAGEMLNLKLMARWKFCGG